MKNTKYFLFGFEISSVPSFPCLSFPINFSIQFRTRRKLFFFKFLHPRKIMNSSTVSKHFYNRFVDIDIPIVFWNFSLELHIPLFRISPRIQNRVCIEVNKTASKYSIDMLIIANYANTKPKIPRVQRCSGNNEI